MKTITFDETKFQLVPIEPSFEMLHRGCGAALETAVLLDDTRFSCERATWDAMLKAAPKVDA